MSSTQGEPGSDDGQAVSREGFRPHIQRAPFPILPFAVEVPYITGEALMPRGPDLAWVGLPRLVLVVPVGLHSA